MKNIFIIEDELLVLRSIEQMLKNNKFSIAGTATSYSEAKEKLVQVEPHLILCDINLNSDKSGLDLMRKYGHTKGIPFVFISAFTDDQTIEAADNLGPYSFISKPFTEKQLVVTLKRFFTLSANQEVAEPTSREKTILRLISRGYSTKQIAEELSVSFNTVETHRKNILRKSEAKTMAELVVIAVSNKWI